MVEPADLKTHLYAELIDAIDRNDEEILMDAIASAEGEAMGYLSRFDVDLLMSAVAEDRDPTLLMYLKDMAVWNFITLANAATDMELRNTRYENAIKWLKGIQAGKIIPKNWPLANLDQPDSFFLVNSAPKRNTRW